MCPLFFLPLLHPSTSWPTNCTESITSLADVTSQYECIIHIQLLFSHYIWDKRLWEDLVCRDVFVIRINCVSVCGPADCWTHGSVSNPNFLSYSSFRSEKSGVVSVSQYSIPAQETVTPLLLKSKALSVGSFLWALFQVCLGHLPVKCKQFTDLQWLGRAEGFSWEECNLNTTSQGGSAARWSIHAYCVRV